MLRAQMDSVDVVTEEMASTSLYSCCAVVRWMAESQHSRACSHYNAVYRKPIIQADWDREAALQLASPKVAEQLRKVYAIKDHTYRERMEGCHPLAISYLAEHPGEHWDIYFEDEDPLLLRVAERWAAEIPQREKHLVSVYMLLRASGLCNPATSRWEVQYHNGMPEDGLAYLKKPFTLDEYVLDKHTAAGRAKGKSKVDFVQEGAKVVNEAFVDEELKQFYTALAGPKRKAPPPPPTVEVKKQKLRTERDLFGGDYMRAQLNTSANRPDTYFVRHPTEGNLFVKGPFLKREHAQVAVLVNKVKHLLDLPFLPKMEVYRLGVDMFPTASPVGLRKDDLREGWFLISSSLLPVELMHTRLKSSKLWPETEVVDWEKLWVEHQLGTMADVSQLQGRDAQMALELLLLRMWLGVPDQAWRNFVKCADGIQAVDDSALWRVDLEKKHRVCKPLCTTFLSLDAQERKKLKKAVRKWADMVDVVAPLLEVETAFLLDRLKKVWACLKLSVQ